MTEPRGAEVDTLPFLTGVEPPVEGTIRSEPADFRVEEVPAYLPAGEGDHLFVQFEKTSINTPDAVRRIARALEVEPKESGYAGLKDRHAITVQWASFLFGDAAKLDTPIDGVRVLQAARHGNKLRTGHLKGNRFDLLVRGAPIDRLADVQDSLATMEKRGVPNYFGAQRFGGSNLRDAKAWLIEGGRKPRKPFLRKLFVSVLQSAVFNELLAARVSAGTLDRAEPGDLLQKTESGGMFPCEDSAVDTPRVESFEVGPTGPMFGPRTRLAEGQVGEREREAQARWGLDDVVMGRFRKAGQGTRRPYRVPLSDAQVTSEPDGLRLRFTLPSGAYATVVLRELLGRADL
ncbi:MAG: tRNA pseudouridine(13) synthase TruD [Sandaracinaceae bacterium]